MGNPLRRHERAPRPSARSSRVHLGRRLARGELAGRGGCSSRRPAARDWSRRRPLSASRLPPATRTCWRLPEPPLTLRSQRPARGLRVAPPPTGDHGVAPQSHAVRTQGHASQSKLSLFLFLAPRGETHRLNPASDARGPRRSCLGPSPAGEQPGHRPAFMPLCVLRPLPLPAKPLCPPAGGWPFWARHEVPALAGPHTPLRGSRSLPLTPRTALVRVWPSTERCFV